MPPPPSPWHLSELTPTHRPSLLARQSLFGNGTATPSSTTNSSGDSSSIWKYAIIVIISVLGLLTLARFLALYRLRRRALSRIPTPPSAAQRRAQTRDVRAALQGAGLLVTPERTEERRERRRERREVRRVEEEGLGLPVYTREKGVGEEVLESGDDAGRRGTEREEELPAVEDWRGEGTEMRVLPGGETTARMRDSTMESGALAGASPRPPPP